jgi:hypothetical protein
VEYHDLFTLSSVENKNVPVEDRLNDPKDSFPQSEVNGKLLAT